MKFLVKRTSLRWEDKKPCKSAKKEKLTYVVYTTVSSFEKAKKYPWFEDWYKNGENFRKENGMLVCDRKEKENVWTIEINNLNELINLIKEEGKIVILETSYKEAPFGIEIYNDYRE